MKANWIGYSLLSMMVQTGLIAVVSRIVARSTYTQPYMYKANFGSFIWPAGRRNLDCCMIMDNLISSRSSKIHEVEVGESSRSAKYT